jgi:hypothetical protein
MSSRSASTGIRRFANWALPGADPKKDALFRANDERGFLVAVEAKVKKNGQSAPKISVVCSLKSFDLVLIAPASFIELNFEKIEFRVDSSARWTWTCCSRTSSSWVR